MPPWMGMWFAVFPTYETLVAQLIAAVLVVGSYYGARRLQQTPEQVQTEISLPSDAAIVERLETIPDASPNERIARRATNSRNGQSVGPIPPLSAVRAASQR
jgi:hypothetical protein